LPKRPRLLSLAEYRNLVGGLNRPSDAQCEAFTRFVATAHSWYKHLSAAPPGSSFTFFLDLFAGCDAVETRDGRTLLVPREPRIPLLGAADTSVSDPLRPFGLRPPGSGPREDDPW
jgi:hypothetical protein